MRTHGTNGSVGGAAKEVAEHANTIARLELQLALLEIKEKVAALGLGAAPAAPSRPRSQPRCRRGSRC
jgi:hypothetical protein